MIHLRRHHSKQTNKQTHLKPVAKQVAATKKFKKLWFLITTIYTKAENILHLGYKATRHPHLDYPWYRNLFLYYVTTHSYIRWNKEIHFKQTLTFSDMYQSLQLPVAFPQRIPHSLLWITYQKWNERWDEMNHYPSTGWQCPFSYNYEMCKKCNEIPDPFSLQLKGDLELKKPKGSKETALYDNDSTECMQKMW